MARFLDNAKGVEISFKPTDTSLSLESEKFDVVSTSDSVVDIGKNVVSSDTSEVVDLNDFANTTTKTVETAVKNVSAEVNNVNFSNNNANSVNANTNSQFVGPMPQQAGYTNNGGAQGANMPGQPSLANNNSLGNGATPSNPSGQPSFNGPNNQGLGGSNSSFGSNNNIGIQNTAGMAGPGVSGGPSASGIASNSGMSYVTQGADVRNAIKDSIPEVGGTLKEVANTSYQNTADSIQTTLRVEDYDPEIQEDIEALRAIGLLDSDIQRLLNGEITLDELRLEIENDSNTYRKKRLYESTLLASYAENEELADLELDKFHNLDELVKHIKELEQQKEDLITEKNMASCNTSGSFLLFIDEAWDGDSVDRCAKSHIAYWKYTDEDGNVSILYENPISDGKNKESRKYERVTYYEAFYGDESQMTEEELKFREKYKTEYETLKKKIDSKADLSGLKDKYQKESDERKKKIAELEKQIEDVYGQIQQYNAIKESINTNVNHQIENVDPYIYNDDYEENCEFDESSRAVFKKYEEKAKAAQANQIPDHGMQHAVVYADNEDVAALIACEFNGETIETNVTFNSEDDRLEHWRKWNRQTATQEIDGKETEVPIISEQDKKTYLYIYNTEGADAALAYLDSLAETVDYNWLNAKRAEDAKFAQEHEILASVGSVFVTPFEGMAAAYNSSGTIMGKIFGKDADAKIYRTDVYSSGITWRSAVSQEIMDYGDGGHTKLAMLYDTTMSMADSGTFLALNYLTAGTITPFLSAAWMGSRAYVSTLNDGLDKGLSDGQAVALAWGSAAVESIMENYSAGHLMKLDKSLDIVAKGLTERIGNLFTNPQVKKAAIKLTHLVAGSISQGLAEGEEELGTEVLNYVLDIFISKDKSDYAQSMEHYLALGYTQEKAELATANELFVRMRQAFVGGLLSGIGFGGFSASRTVRSISKRAAADIENKYSGNTFAEKYIDIWEQDSIARAELEANTKSLAEKLHLKNLVVNVKKIAKTIIDTIKGKAGSFGINRNNTSAKNDLQSNINTKSLNEELDKISKKYSQYNEQIMHIKDLLKTKASDDTIIKEYANLVNDILNQDNETSRMQLRMAVGNYNNLSAFELQEDGSYSYVPAEIDSTAIAEKMLKDGISITDSFEKISEYVGRELSSLQQVLKDGKINNYNGTAKFMIEYAEHNAEAVESMQNSAYITSDEKVLVDNYNKELKNIRENIATYGEKDSLTKAEYKAMNEQFEKLLGIEASLKKINTAAWQRYFQMSGNAFIHCFTQGPVSIKDFKGSKICTSLLTHQSGSLNVFDSDGAGILFNSEFDKIDSFAPGDSGSWDATKNAFIDEGANDFWQYNADSNIFYEGGDHSILYSPEFIENAANTSGDFTEIVFKNKNIKNYKYFISDLSSEDTIKSVYRLAQAEGVPVVYIDSKTFEKTTISEEQKNRLDIINQNLMNNNLTKTEKGILSKAKDLPSNVSEIQLARFLYYSLGRKLNYSNSYRYYDMYKNNSDNFEQAFEDIYNRNIGFAELENNLEGITCVDWANLYSQLLIDAGFRKDQIVIQRAVSDNSIIDGSHTGIYVILDDGTIIMPDLTLPLNDMPDIGNVKLNEQTNGFIVFTVDQQKAILDSFNENYEGDLSIRKAEKFKSGDIKELINLMKYVTKQSDVGFEVENQNFDRKTNDSLNANQKMFFDIVGQFLYANQGKVNTKARRKLQSGLYNHLLLENADLLNQTDSVFEDYKNNISEFSDSMITDIMQRFDSETVNKYLQHLLEKEVSNDFLGIDKVKFNNAIDIRNYLSYVVEKSGLGTQSDSNYYISLTDGIALSDGSRKGIKIQFTSNGGIIPFSIKKGNEIVSDYVVTINNGEVAIYKVTELYQQVLSKLVDKSIPIPERLALEKISPNMSESEINVRLDGAEELSRLTKLIECDKTLNKSIDKIKELFFKFYGVENKATINQKFNNTQFLAYQSIDGVRSIVSAYKTAKSIAMVESIIAKHNLKLNKEDLIGWGSSFDNLTGHPINNFFNLLADNNAGKEGRMKNAISSEYDYLKSFVPNIISNITIEEVEEIANTGQLPDKYSNLPSFAKNHVLFNLNSEMIERSFYQQYSNLEGFLKKINPDISKDNFQDYLKKPEFVELYQVQDSYFEAVDEYEQAITEIKKYTNEIKNDETLFRKLDDMYNKQFIVDNMDLVPEESKENLSKYIEGALDYYQLDGYSKFIFYQSLDGETDVDCFSKESDALLNDKGTSDWRINTIKTNRIAFFKLNGLDLGDVYEDYVNNEEAQKIWPTTSMMERLQNSRKKYRSLRNEAVFNQTERYRKTKEELLNPNLINKSQDSEIMKYTYGEGGTFVYPNVKISPSGYELAPVVAIDCKNPNDKYLDHKIIHEINHLFELILSKANNDSYEVICGWDVISHDNNTDIELEDNSKREFEMLNEIINEKLAQDISSFMIENGFYIFNKPGSVAIKGETTYEFSSFLVNEFYNEYKEKIIESRREGNIQILFDTVGKENFKELNNLFHIFYENIDESSYRKLIGQLNQNEDTELTRLYKDLVMKRDEVLKRMKEYSKE